MKDSYKQRIYGSYILYARLVAAILVCFEKTLDSTCNNANCAASDSANIATFVY